MSPVTRSSEMLNILDGLFFIEQDVIDLASDFYTELRRTMATFGDASIERLIPHVTALLTKLDNLCKSNNDLQREVNSLKDSLVDAEERCYDLNVSFKDRSVACCLLEDQHDVEISDLNKQLVQVRQENASLKGRIDSSIPLETGRLIEESEEKLAALTAERKCLMTTVQVLEADVKCLRAELRKAESRARQRRSTVDDSLLAEMTAAAEQQHHSPQPGNNSSNDASTGRVSVDKTSPSPPHELDMNSVLIIGDSHMRYASKQCVERGAFLECCPGGKIVDIKNRLISYVDKCLSVIYIHVGCNNLKYGYRGGAAYNGGHGKREALHSMADLLYTAKTKFPEAKVVLSSVLVRRDISWKALGDFNTQLELMCWNFDVQFVEANSCVRRQDLCRDGVHFSRRGVSLLEKLIVTVVSSALQRQNTSLGTSTHPASSLCAETENLYPHSPPASPNCSRVTGH